MATINFSPEDSGYRDYTDAEGNRFVLTNLKAMLGGDPEDPYEGDKYAIRVERADGEEEDVGDAATLAEARQVIAGWSASAADEDMDFRIRDILHARQQVAEGHWDQDFADNIIATKKQQLAEAGIPFEDDDDDPEPDPPAAAEHIFDFELDDDFADAEFTYPELAPLIEERAGFRTTGMKHGAVQWMYPQLSPREVTEMYAASDEFGRAAADQYALGLFHEITFQRNDLTMNEGQLHLADSDKRKEELAKAIAKNKQQIELRSKTLAKLDPKLFSQLGIQNVPFEADPELAPPVGVKDLTKTLFSYQNSLMKLSKKKDLNDWESRQLETLPKIITDYERYVDEVWDGRDFREVQQEIDDQHEVAAAAIRGRQAGEKAMGSYNNPDVWDAFDRIDHSTPEPELEIEPEPEPEPDPEPEESREGLMSQAQYRYDLATEKLAWLTQRGHEDSDEAHQARIRQNNALIDLDMLKIAAGKDTETEPEAGTLFDIDDDVPEPDPEPEVDYGFVEPAGEFAAHTMPSFEAPEDVADDELTIHNILQEDRFAHLVPDFHEDGNRSNVFFIVDGEIVDKHLMKHKYHDGKETSWVQGGITRRLKTLNEEKVIRPWQDVIVTVAVGMRIKQFQQKLSYSYGRYLSEEPEDIQQFDIEELEEKIMDRLAAARRFEERIADMDDPDKIASWTERLDEINDKAKELATELAGLLDDNHTTHIGINNILGVEDDPDDNPEPDPEPPEHDFVDPGIEFEDWSAPILPEKESAAAVFASTEEDFDAFRSISGLPETEKDDPEPIPELPEHNIFDPVRNKMEDLEDRLRKLNIDNADDRAAIRELAEHGRALTQEYAAIDRAHGMHLSDPDLEEELEELLVDIQTKQHQHTMDSLWQWTEEINDEIAKIQEFGLLSEDDYIRFSRQIANIKTIFSDVPSHPDEEELEEHIRITQDLLDETELEEEELEPYTPPFPQTHAGDKYRPSEEEWTAIERQYTKQRHPQAPEPRGDSYEYTTPRTPRPMERLRKAWRDADDDWGPLASFEADRRRAYARDKAYNEAGDVPLPEHPAHAKYKTPSQNKVPRVPRAPRPPKPPEIPRPASVPRPPSPKDIKALYTPNPYRENTENHPAFDAERYGRFWHPEIQSVAKTPRRPMITPPSHVVPAFNLWIETEIKVEKPSKWTADEWGNPRKKQKTPKQRLFKV